MRSGKKRRNRSRFSDPMVVSRVKTYLAENVDKPFVDVGRMVRSLRERYREYATRNESGFYQTVEAAYDIVLKSYGLEDVSSSSSSDGDSDDLEVLEEGAATGGLNDRIEAMYDKNKRPKKSNDVEAEKSELIDISSDDSSKSPLPNSEPAVADAASEPKSPSPPPKRTRQASEQREILSNNDNASTGRKRKPVKRTIKPNQKSTSPERPRQHYTSYVTFHDVGGIDHIMEQICDLVLHMKHPEVFKKLGIKAPRGALLHGPPGTGKTLLANAISGQLKIPIISVVATELVGGVSGESEKMIRDIFETALDLAPCILFIDEIDSICGNRLNAQKDMERRMVAQLLTSIDSLDGKGPQVLLLAATNTPESLDPGLRRAGRLEQEIPLGIPTLLARKDILRILCRNLNFNTDINLDVIAQLTPGFVGADLQALINKACTFAVKRIFKHLRETTRSHNENRTVNIDNKPIVIPENGEVAIEEGQKNPENKDTSTPIINVDDPDQDDVTVNNKVVIGQEALNSNHAVENNESCSITPKIKENVINEKQHITSSLDEVQKYLNETHNFTSEQLSNMKIVQDDFFQALKTTKPCAIREGIATVPDTTWDDIGSLAEVRRDLQLAVLAPVKYPEQLDALGLIIPSGVLLCGPPGCGKTLLAKAVANEAGINFISVKGPELLNMYVGESERAVRTCFSRARNSAPCVIFFDEFDSLCPKRQNSDVSGATRVVNQLLTEMDGVEGREGVFVLAATNRPDIIDPAVLRPGRLDRILFVGMPMLEDRRDILRAITKKGTKPFLGPDVDFETIAKATEGYTGADLAGLIRQAATEALTDFITGTISSDQLAVSANHFQVALAKMRPSVSQKELQHYEKLRLKYASQNDEKIDVEMDTTESMDTV